MALNLPNRVQERLNVQPNEFVTAPVLNRANNRLLENDEKIKTWVSNLEDTTISTGLSGTIDAETVSQIGLDFSEISNNIASNAVLGAILPYAGPEGSIPSFSILCSGGEVSRTTYSNLFSVIGTIYGAGDGSTTFNVPDLRGRDIICADNMGGNNANRIDAASIPNRDSDSWDEILGGTAGEDLHQLTIPEMASHTHALHSDRVCKGCGVNRAIANEFVEGQSTQASSFTGGDAAHNTFHPVMAVNYIIIST
jgi:microcystin-dependent protein